MPRTALTVQTLVGPYPASVAAEDLDITFAAADVANMNEFAFTGREIILVENTDAGAQTITFTSIADSFGREEDIAAYSLAAGEFAGFWAGALGGWAQAGNLFFLEASAATVKFAILRIP